MTRQSDGVGLTRRALYKKAIQWIAENDNDADLEVDDGNDYLTMVLTAHIFDVPIEDVADNVRTLRRLLIRSAKGDK